MINSGKKTNKELIRDASLPVCAAIDEAMLVIASSQLDCAQLKVTVADIIKVAELILQRYPK